MSRTRVSWAVGVIAAGAVVAAALAGWGASAHARAAAGPFAWLRPGLPPNTWNLIRTPSGAELAYPPGWRPIKTDRGTASVALLDRAGRIEGYLNATPRQGDETPANWSRFRPQHNQGEGQRGVRLLASINRVRFLTGRGSCVIDSYTTTKASYREIACLVSGPRSSAVVVAAARSGLWSQQAATLERAVSSFLA